MRSWGVLLGIVQFGCLLAGYSPAGTWLTGSVNDALGGKYSSLKFDSYGNAHVAYFDETSSKVGYSFWDRGLNRWFSTSVDNGSGFCSLGLDSKQRPHIVCAPGNGSLRHAYFDGTAWQKQVIDVHARVINYYTSIALDANDNPSISFYEELGAGDNRLRLRVATWNGRFWEVRTVDSDLGSGKFNSIAINRAGGVEIAYGVVEYQNASLRYARWNGHAWDIDVLEGAGTPGTSMWSVAMLLDQEDVPHIAYTDVVRRLVKYATKKNGKWLLTAVDSVAGVGYPDRNGIALDSRGIPYLSYYDAGSGVLKIAHQDGEKWFVEAVDSDFAGFTSSLQIDRDWIWVTYANNDGELLKVARRKLEAPSR